MTYALGAGIQPLAKEFPIWGISELAAAGGDDDGTAPGYS